MNVLMYNLAFFCFMIVSLPFLLTKGKGGVRRIKERLLCPLSEGWNPEGRPVVWVHAVSVGEVMAAVPFIEVMERRWGETCQVVLSTVTATGLQTARALRKGRQRVIYAPADFSWVVRRFIRILQPKIYVVMETEWWPNLYVALHQNGIPIVVVNGRVSDASFRGYRRIRDWTADILRRVAAFYMQSQRDADRVTALGASTDRVWVTGNMKFDNVALARNPEDFPVKKGLACWVAGSTHPGEEAILLEIYRRLRQDVAELALILAPRHVERADQVVALARSQGFSVKRFSETGLDRPMQAGEVMVIDTLGVLKRVYSLASVVFVGKSFRVGGGQNMIEPAALGKPVFVGPRTQNFRDVMQLFLQDSAIRQVNTPDELYEGMLQGFREPETWRQMGRRAQQVVKKQQGATARVVSALEEVWRP